MIPVKRPDFAADTTLGHSATFETALSHTGLASRLWAAKRVLRRAERTHNARLVRVASVFVEGLERQLAKSEKP